MRKPCKDIVEVLFMLTTRCNMCCPECLFDIPRRKHPHDLTVEEIEKAAGYLYGVSCLHLTGGEPTLYKGFEDLVPVLKKMFGCKSLALSTNGWGVGKYPASIFLHFHSIYASQYAPGFYPGFKGNKDSLDELEKICAGTETHFTRGILGLGSHISRAKVSNGKSCHRASIASVLVHDGRMYPCCASGAMWPETENQVGIPLTATWRKDIFRVNLLCANCFFSV